MTLLELQAETLVAKHRRLQRAKCKHEEIHSSMFVGPHDSFTSNVCLDCGKSWHIALKGAQ
jgi:hypothetical protein